MGDNMSGRPERYIDFDPTWDTSGDGITDNDQDILLPRGRWILPDDWPILAGPDWDEQRIHWDIMDNPWDTVGDPNSSPPTAGQGNYVKPYTTGALVAEYPVIGPFRPGVELPTSTGYEPGIPTWAVPQEKTVVPNDLLEWWDAPMPPAKITFEIMNGVGFFKDAWKADIYYVMVGTTKVYTNPFYFVNIPAHPQIPAFVNNGGYDWNRWDDNYGPYEFWKIFNRPVPGDVPSSDSSNFPTKVQVYSDNHGEAMVYLNGNWNLDLSPWLSNGGADVPFGATVGTTTAVAMADYPYFRKHAKQVSNTVEKTWLWGGLILGTDEVDFPAGADQPAMRMILTTGTYVIDLPENPPNDTGTSMKKMVFLWITDRDHMRAGVMDAVIEYNVTNGGGAVTISGITGTGLSTYPGVTNIGLENGFLEGIGGVITDWPLAMHGISRVKVPTADEAALFDKFEASGVFPAGSDPDDYVVAGVELLTSDATLDITLQTKITSKDFGLSPGITGTLIRNTNVNFAASYPLDDAPIYGDANRDGTVNMGDVTAVERTILGLNALYIGADANIDDSVDMGDVVKIERKILGLD
jgi:hypothetical protein